MDDRGASGYDLDTSGSDAAADDVKEGQAENRLDGLKKHTPVKTRRKIIAMVLSAVLFVAAVSIYVGTRPKVQTVRAVDKPVAYFGPRIVIGSNVQGATIGNNTTINVQIYSSVPDAFAKNGIVFHNMSSGNQWNNSVNDELLNATMLPGNNSTGKFFLSPQFNSIAEEWMSLLSKDTGSNYPSLTVEAVKTVESNGSLHLYQYYNNLPFNPFVLSVVSANSTVLSNSTLLSSTGLESWFNDSGVNLSNYSNVYLANLNFNLTLLFPSVPLQVIPVNSSASESPSYSNSGTSNLSVSSPESCYWIYYYTYPSSTSNTLEKTTYANGMLPLLGVHIGRNADQGGSEVDIGTTISIASDNISLNSNQVYVSSSGSTTTTMGTQPSFTHLANASASTSGNGYGAIPLGIDEKLGNNFSVSQNRTTAFAGVQGVEYEFQHYNRYTYDYKDYWADEVCQPYRYPPHLLSQTLISKTYDGNFTIGEIVHINSTAGLQVQAGYASIWEAWVIQHLLLQDSNGTIQLTDSGNTSSYQAATIWAMTYGWTNAGSAYAAAANALNIFSSALSLGLAIISVAAAANVIDLDSTEAVVVSTAASIIAATTAQAATLLGLFSSISFVSGSRQIINTYWLTNQPLIGSGSNYTMPFYESSYPVTFTLPNGASYLFYAPEDYLNATGIA